MRIDPVTDNSLMPARVKRFRRGVRYWRFWSKKGRLICGDLAMECRYFSVEDVGFMWSSRLVIMNLRGDCSSILNGLNPKLAEMLINMLLKEFHSFSLKPSGIQIKYFDCFYATILTKQPRWLVRIRASSLVTSSTRDRKGFEMPFSWNERCFLTAV